MIAKMTSNSSRNIARSMSYILANGKGAEVISYGGYMPDADITRNAELWEFNCKFNGRVKNRVDHYVFSHSAADTQRMTPQLEQQVLIELDQQMKKRGINLDESPYLMVAHREQNGKLHYHLLRCVVGYNGQRINSSFIGLKLKEVAVLTSLKFGLEQPKWVLDYAAKVAPAKKVESKQTVADRISRKKAIEDSEERKLERGAITNMRLVSESVISDKEDFKADTRNEAVRRAMSYLFDKTAAEGRNKRIMAKDFEYNEERKCFTAKLQYESDPNYVLLHQFVNNNYSVVYTNDAELRLIKQKMMQDRKLEKQFKAERKEKRKSRGMRR